MNYMESRNRLKYKLIFLFLFFVVFSCKEKTTKNKPEESKKQEIILIYLDFTQSADSSVISQLIDQKFRALLNKAPLNSKIYCKVISNIENQDFIIEYTKPNISKLEDLDDVILEDANKRKRDILVSKMKNDIDSLVNLSKVAYNNFIVQDNLRAIGRENHPSCLIKTLESAYNLFNSFYKTNPDRYEMRLVYFSDMIEQCTNYFDYLTMCDLPPDSIEKKIDLHYNPSFDLKKVIKNNVHFIMTQRSEGSNKSCFDNHYIQKIWAKIFSKIGYSINDFNNFDFGTSVPGCFDYDLDKDLKERDETELGF